MRWGDIAGCTLTPCCVAPARSGREETIVSSAPKQLQPPPMPLCHAAVRPLPGARGARAQGRETNIVQGDWVRAQIDITVKGEVALPAGSCARVVAPPESGRLTVELLDAHGDRRVVRVAREKVDRLRYKDARKQQEAAAAAEKARANRIGACFVEGLGNEESISDSQQLRLYTNERNGQVFRARSAEAAAKKAWRCKKKHQEVTMVDERGDQSTHHRTAFAVPGNEGARGGPKFSAGKRGKRDPHRVRRWSGYSQAYSMAADGWE
eukprot:TRINITY_DN6531_c0_g2_i1.p1 TRINITY_DN6531_c0_g2~~TRINITY_DN6531_c0_g2_i1.p1  ORF type:complete len:296 (+),score=62.23 TRINITY_DN6531_c0_g2_i1:93-890(+)